MFELKRITPEAVPSALSKAERYRLLNEPEEAESICLDVLAVEPANQAALIMLLLSLTDQFPAGRGECVAEAEAVLPRLAGEYERRYYAGIIWERRATARLHRGGTGGSHAVAHWLRQAMGRYEAAEAIRPAGHDDAILRWNNCARLFARHHLETRPEVSYEPALDD